MSKRKFEKEIVYDAESKTKIVSLKPIEVPREVKTTLEIATANYLKANKWVPLESYQEQLELQQEAFTKQIGYLKEDIQKLEDDFNNVSEVVKFLQREKEQLEADNQKLKDENEDKKLTIIRCDTVITQRELEAKTEYDYAELLKKELAAAKRRVEAESFEVLRLETKIGEAGKILNEFPTSDFQTMGHLKPISTTWKGEAVQEWLGRLRAVLSAGSSTKESALEDKKQ